MKEEKVDFNSNYNNLLKNLCNILKDRSNKESSYATFCQSESIIVNLNEFFPFNIVELENKDIFLLNPTDIHVKKSGVYHIIYKIPIVSEEKNNKIEQSLNLYLNGILQKNIQRSFVVADPNHKKRLFIIEDLIIYIPDNSTIQLKNTDFSTYSKSLFTNNTEDSFSSFNIVKIG